MIFLRGVAIAVAVMFAAVIVFSGFLVIASVAAILPFIIVGALIVFIAIEVCKGN